MELNEFLSMVSQALLIITLPILIAAAVQTLRVQSYRLKNELGEDNFNALKSIVQTAVQVAEQSGIIDRLTGPEKRKQAIDFVQKYLNERGVAVDVDQIAALIESEVLNQFKNPVAPVDSAASRQALIDQAVEAAVLAAEQSGLQGIISNVGQQKKAYALDLAKTYLGQHGIAIPDELTAGLIEAQVLRFMMMAQGLSPTAPRMPSANTPAG